MKTWGTILCATMVAALCGCQSNAKVKQKLAETEMQARVATLTDAVRLAYAKSGNPVVSDFLSNVPKSGAAGATFSERAIRMANGDPVLVNGVPQMEKQTAVGLLNSMRDFGAFDEAYLVLGGWGVNPKTGEIQTNATVGGLFVWMESPGGSSTMNAAFAQVWATATSTEKKTILDGMKDLATAEGAAFAVRFTAVAGGITQVLTETGVVVGKILSATVVSTPAGLAAQGVSKIVSALIQKTDGTTTKVLAADTPTSTAATDCVGCGEPYVEPPK